MAAGDLGPPRWRRVTWGHLYYWLLFDKYKTNAIQRLLLIPLSLNEVLVVQAKKFKRTVAVRFQKVSIFVTSYKRVMTLSISF